MKIFLEATTFLRACTSLISQTPYPTKAKLTYSQREVRNRALATKLHLKMFATLFVSFAFFTIVFGPKETHASERKLQSMPISQPELTKDDSAHLDVTENVRKKLSGRWKCLYSKSLVSDEELRSRKQYNQKHPEHFELLGQSERIIYPKNSKRYDISFSFNDNDPSSYYNVFQTSNDYRHIELEHNYRNPGYESLQKAIQEHPEVYANVDMGNTKYIKVSILEIDLDKDDNELTVLTTYRNKDGTISDEYCQRYKRVHK